MNKILDLAFGVAIGTFCVRVAVRQWRGLLIRSIAPPPFWPWWGWGWRAFGRGGPVLLVGMGGPIVVTAVLVAVGDRRAGEVVFLVAFGAAWLIFAAITLWARPKRLIPPWARAQSGAVREWGDWWKLRGSRG